MYHTGLMDENASIGNTKDETASNSPLSNLGKTPIPESLFYYNQREYQVVYLGYAVLDHRYTLPMLPWLMAEIKRRNRPESVTLQVTHSALKALDIESRELLFEHLLPHVNMFAQSSRDPKCFSYMTRSSAYHVFRATEENTVLELFTVMKEMSKEMYNQPQKPSDVSNIGLLDSVVNSCQQYEVLYLGRIKVCGKRAHPTFIDDAVEKFKVYEMEKTCNSKNSSRRERHGSGTSISSLPYSLGSIKSTENKIKSQVRPSSKEDSSSGVSSCESISQKNCDTFENVAGDKDYLLQSSHSSFDFSHDSKSLNSPNCHISHSKSMDVHFASLPSSKKSDSSFKSYLIPPSSLITHTQSLDSKGCIETVHNLMDIDSNVAQRNRVRSCSGEISRIKQTSLPIYPHREESGMLVGLHRPRAYTSPSPSSTCENNRTMLFLIGDMQICLIGTDQKQMLLNKTFNDISHCSQGVKHVDHFGFVCREVKSSGGEYYSGYVFRCQTVKVVDEIMQTLKLAFSKAHQIYQRLSERSPVTPKILICESCPMQWFHKICLDVEGLTIEETNLTIVQKLDLLTDSHKNEIMIKFQNSNVASVQDQNEVLMTLLREFVEQRQLSHSHPIIGSHGKNESTFLKEKGSRLDSFREKAKKSLSNSFETFLKLTNRDEMKDSTVHFPNKLSNIKESSKKNFDPRSFREGSCDSALFSLGQATTTSRPRSSTFGSSREMHASEIKPSRHDQESLQNKKPVINMLKKVKNQVKDSSPDSVETKGSWRQAIFHQVQTPSHDKKHSRDRLDGEFNTLTPTKHNLKVESKRTKEDYRALWKKAIVEQILLIRMEKENKNLQVNQDAVCHKRMKLDYEEITPCIKEVSMEWEALLNSMSEDTSIDRKDLINLVKNGIPRHKRGEIWEYLVIHHKITYNIKSVDEPADLYQGLLKQLTSHQHSILIDIGRTFPNHPFYSQTLGCGQLSLFNLLKAYSLLDTEVGYCQGLSFVAGILLLHMPEEQAFFTMKYLMFDIGLRRQYKTDMIAFQIQMYQLSRLIHDNFKDLYEHFEQFDIAPTLYAAPWFLTLFASQFPVGFVSRFFDIFFLFGIDVVFKVSLLLLANHKDQILACDSFESTMNFLKVSLPSTDSLQMEIIFSQVFNLDISRQLHAYEVEYHVLMEEMITMPSKNSAQLDNLKSANKSLKAQNMELMEQLQIAYSRIHNLEASEISLKSTIHRLENRVGTLEDEKEALMHSMRAMKRRVQKLEMARMENVLSEEEENESHPPPFGVVYAMAGSEREEDEQFKMLIRDYCLRKDSKKSSEIDGSNAESWNPVQSDISKENVFEDS